MTAMLLAVVLPALGCLLAGLAGGRAWGRAGLDDATEDAYYKGRVDEKESRSGGHRAVVISDDCRYGAHEDCDGCDCPCLHPLAADDGPLVPLPDRLPDADTLTRMYAQLGDDTQLPPAGVASSETLGPRPGDSTPVTDWDAAEPAERVPTIGELAADAEYRVCWAEIAGLRDSARQWYADTFSTGTLPAVR